MIEADDLDRALAIRGSCRPRRPAAARWKCGPSSKDSSVALDAVFRDHWGRVVATLTGVLGDIELAEEAAAEAFAIAATRWPHDGEPTNPIGWLIATARNRAIDQIRRQRVLAAKTKLRRPTQRLAAEAAMHDAVTIPDERLELIFTCCHPALALDAQVALTLRTLGGLSTEGSRSRFLVPFDTMSKRLTHAKHKTLTRIPFAVPPEHQLPDRLAAVLAVLYLIFNEGWGGGRVDLADRGDAASAGRSPALMPDEAEVLAAPGPDAPATTPAATPGMRDGHARRRSTTRTDRIVEPADQIADGRALLERATALRESGLYVLQAAIADLHTREPRDWNRSLGWTAISAGSRRRPSSNSTGRSRSARSPDPTPPSSS